MSINYYENESHLGSRSNYDRMQFGQYVLGDNTLNRLPPKDESDPFACSNHLTPRDCVNHGAPGNSTRGCFWDVTDRCIDNPYISLCNNNSHSPDDRCVNFTPGLDIKVNQCYTLDDTIGGKRLADTLKWGQKCNFNGVSNLPVGYKLTAYDLKGSWPSTKTNCPKRSESKSKSACYAGTSPGCIWNNSDPKNPKCEWESCSTLAPGTWKHDTLESPNCTSLEKTHRYGQYFGNMGGGWTKYCENNEGWPDSACSFMVECADGWELNTEDGKCKRVAPKCGDPCRSASDCKNVSGCPQCVNGKCTNPLCKMKPFDNACSCVDNADCKSDYCEIADGVPPTCQDPAAPPTLWRFV